MRLRALTPFTAWIIVLGLPWPVWAAAQPVDEGPRISVLSFDPGVELFSAFGHIAIVVEDRATLQQKAYNFGTYDFGAKDALWQYAKGNLDYWISVASYASTLTRYRAFNRGAQRRELAIHGASAIALAQALEKSTLPANRVYRYQHFTNNCCTKVRDLIDQATGGALRKQFRAERAHLSYRQWIWRSLKQQRLWQLTLDFVLGPAADRPIRRYEEEFMPAVLVADLDRVLVPAPLVTRKTEVLARSATSHGGTGTETNAVMLAALTLALLFATALPITAGPSPGSRRVLGLALAMYGTAAGGLGLALAFLQWTAHSDTHGNENQLLTPLLHLGLVAPGLALLVRGRLGRSGARMLMGYVTAALVAVVAAAALKAVPGTQANERFIACAAIYNSLLLVAAWRCGLTR